jgi:hypothetical protein
VEKLCSDPRLCSNEDSHWSGRELRLSAPDRRTAERLDRTLFSVQNKRLKMGIPMSKPAHRSWTATASDSSSWPLFQHFSVSVSAFRSSGHDGGAPGLNAILPHKRSGEMPQAGKNRLLTPRPSFW